MDIDVVVRATVMSRVRKEITDIFHRNGRRSRGHFVISRLRVID